MFIRKFAIRSKKTCESHTYHTVMQTTRQGDRVVSNTVLTLWPDFDVPQEKWKQLIFRVENILSGQGSLWPLSPDLADVAQRIADSITERRLNPPKPRQSRKFNVSYPARSWISSGPNDAHFQVAWLAMERIGFTEAFASIGLSPEKANVAKCLVAARML